MFDSIAKQQTWNGVPGQRSASDWQTWNPSAPAMDASIENGGTGQGQPGMSHLTPEYLKAVGFNGPATTNFGDQTQADQNNPALADWLQNNGYHFQTQSAGTQGYGRLMGANGQIGDTQQWTNDPDNAFGLAMLAASGFAGASAAGAFGGSGAFGSGAASGGAGGGLAGKSSADLAALYGNAGYSGGIGGSGIPEYAGFTGAGSSPTLVAGPGGAGLGESAAAGAANGSWDVLPAASGGGYGGATTPALMDSAVGSAGYGASSAGLGGGVGDLAGIAGPTVGGGSGGWLSDAANWAGQHQGLVNTGGQLVNGLTGYLSASNALSAQKDATNQANALWAPYREAGNNAVGKLNGLMQNPSSITSDPGYQFGLNQGQTAIDRSAASKGGFYSGATLKALDRYGTDYSGTKLNDAYSRYGGVAQLGATGTTNTSNNITNLGNAGAASSLYTGNVLQQGTNNALANFNQSNGQSTYGGYPQYPGYPGQRP